MNQDETTTIADEIVSFTVTGNGHSGKIVVARLGSMITGTVIMDGETVGISTNDHTDSPQDITGCFAAQVQHYQDWIDETNAVTAMLGGQPAEVEVTHTGDGIVAIQLTPEGVNVIG